MGKSYLKDLRLGRVDFVDRGAQEHSRIAIFKRDSNAHQQEHNMPKLEDLPEEVQKSVAPLLDERDSTIEELKAEIEELRAAAPDPNESEEDVSKRDDLPEDVRVALQKRDDELAALREQVAKSEETAAAERKERRTRDWRDTIAKYDALNLDQDEYAERMIALEDADSEVAADVVKMFDTINARVSEIDEQLFEPIGKSYDGEPRSNEEKLEKIAKGYRETDPSLTEAQAMAKAVDANPALTKES